MALNDVSVIFDPEGLLSILFDEVVGLSISHFCRFVKITLHFHDLRVIWVDFSGDQGI
jgi:hypothetical protein